MATLTSSSYSTIVRFTFATLAHRAGRLGMSVASVLAPHWAVRTASRWFVTPPRFAHTRAELASLANATRHDIASPVGRLAAWRFGDAGKPAVIASHGWGGRGAQFRAFVPALVDAGFQVWLFDHIGHGLSEGRQASLVDFAKGVVALHRHVATDGVPVRGYITHSLGGAAVATAMRNGVPRARVVMVAPPASLVRYSRFFAKYIGISERVRAAMQWRFEARYGVRWHEFELPQAVDRIDAPALVIHDSHDDDVPFAAGLAVARAWPDARLVRTERLGHRRVLRDARVIRDAVDFVRDARSFPYPSVEDEWATFPGKIL